MTTLTTKLKQLKSTYDYKRKCLLKEMSFNNNQKEKQKALVDFEKELFLNASHIVRADKDFHRFNLKEESVLKFFISLKHIDNEFNYISKILEILSSAKECPEVVDRYKLKHLKSPYDISLLKSKLQQKYLRIHNYELESILDKFTPFELSSIINTKRYDNLTVKELKKLVKKDDEYRLMISKKKEDLNTSSFLYATEEFNKKLEDTFVNSFNSSFCKQAKIIFELIKNEEKEEMQRIGLMKNTIKAINKFFN